MNALIRTMFCQEFGWTFAEFDAADWGDVMSTWALWVGMQKAKANRAR